MESAAAPAPSQAVCPAHPARPAIAACERCGTFLCEGCAASVAPPLCALCLSKKGLPLLGQPFAFGTAFVGAWQLLLPRLGLVALACAVWSVPVGLSNFLWAWFPAAGRDVPTLLLTYGSMLVAGLVGLFAELGCIALMISVGEERPASLGWALAEGVRAWPRTFAARLIAGIQIMLWSLLLVFPGFVKAVRLSLVTVVAYRDESADPCGHSESLVLGRGWELFGLLLVAQIVATVATVVVSAALQALPVFSPLLALPVQVAVAWVTLMAAAYKSAVDLAAYYGLSRTREG